MMFFSKASLAEKDEPSVIISTPSLALRWFISAIERMYAVKSSMAFFCEVDAIGAGTSLPGAALSSPAGVFGKGASEPSGIGDAAPIFVPGAMLATWAE